MFMYACGVGVAALTAYVYNAVRNSKLTEFNEPSRMFRVVYALYNSSLGQFIHNYFLFSHQNSTEGRPHTEFCEKLEEYDTFYVFYVPYLQDNYGYFVVDKGTGNVAVVDPADPVTVLEQFQKLKEKCRVVELSMVLCTHKHVDHSGGNTALLEKFPNLKVVSGTEESCAGQNVFVADDKTVSLGETPVRILHTPAHTIGHVAFFVGSNVLFSGDTLFAGGCGKFFEGDPATMYRSLYETLAKRLPQDTKIYCGHEYTVANLQFCLLVEPENDSVKRRLAWAMSRRKARLPTIPSVLKEEFESNVFLRADKESVAKRFASVGGGGSSTEAVIERLGLLRKWKDSKKTQPPGRL
eukprot:g5705.t1